MGQLEGKRAVITGGGRGIGRGIAEAFAREGCAVVVTARSNAEIEEAAAAIAEAGGYSVAIPCDVADAASVAAMAERVLEAIGGVDILVNNAGLARFAPFPKLTLADWQASLDVNLTGAFLCTQAFLPGMMEHGAGRIINVSSVTGIKAIEEQAAYCAAKHGLVGLTKSLALELRPHGIHVHALCPGGVATRMTEEAMPDRDKSDWPRVEDMAEAALYLATMNARVTTDILIVRRFQSTPLW